MANRTKTIFYFFDFLSPYSYFSWHNTKNDSKWIDTYQVHYKPVVMAKLFSHHEFKGPGEIPAKRNYLFKNCLRYAFHNKIPFQVPQKLPFNPLYALRLATLENSGGDRDLQRKVIDALWHAAWRQSLDMENPDILEHHLFSLGLPGKELLASSYSREVKLALKRNIEEALNLGCFGVPSFSCEGELFWGNDSLNDLKIYLNGEDPLSLWPDTKEKWHTFLGHF